jgi:hypothetical protein
MTQVHVFNDTRISRENFRRQNGISSRAVISYQKEHRQRRRGCNLADVNILIINYLHYDSLFRYDYLDETERLKKCFF